MTGGTAASRGYLQHRFSDDLDLFANDEPEFGLWAGRVIAALSSAVRWQVDVVLNEDHRQVVEALRSLPHRQRDCLILRYYDELGIDDIADALGISRNSVKTHLTRGSRSLEAAMAAHPDEQLQQ